VKVCPFHIGIVSWLTAIDFKRDETHLLRLVIDLKSDDLTLWSVAGIVLHTHTHTLGLISSDTMSSFVSLLSTGTCYILVQTVCHICITRTICNWYTVHDWATVSGCVPIQAPFDCNKSPWRLHKVISLITDIFKSNFS